MQEKAKEEGAAKKLTKKRSGRDKQITSKSQASHKKNDSERMTKNDKK
jgi:hypothetical protein